MKPCKFCKGQHKTWNAIARCKLKYASWINGEGRYALLAWCKPLSVTLHETRESAEKDKAGIDKTACGGNCVKNHVIWDLAYRS